MENLVGYCVEWLDIQKPVEFRIEAYRGKMKLAGLCESRYRKDKLHKHVIFLNLEVIGKSEYNLNDVIAHELIHAHMVEHGLFDEHYHHNETFQKLAQKLANDLISEGFDIETLYDSRIDTE